MRRVPPAGDSFEYDSGNTAELLLPTFYPKEPFHHETPCAVLIDFRLRAKCVRR